MGYIWALLYVSMATVLFIHSNNATEPTWRICLWAQLLIIFAFLFYICLLGKLKFSETDPWAGFDVLILGFLGYYLIKYELTDHDADPIGDLKAHASRRAIVNLLIWFRMISFLRMFKTTRIFIFMLLEVVHDLVGFLVVLFLFLCAFATSHSILDAGTSAFLKDENGI